MFFMLSNSKIDCIFRDLEIICEKYGSKNIHIIIDSRYVKYNDHIPSLEPLM